MLDLKFAVKSLVRAPAFTLIAVVTLGLGIGANTAMFSVLNGYMLRPAPYPDRDRLERIFRAVPGEPRGGIPPADWLDLKKDNGYGELAAYAYSDISLAQPGKPAELAVALRVTSNLFSLLGTRPRLGRDFRPDEEIAGNHRSLIISERYWLNHFGGDPGVIGQTVRVDGEAYDIVGVLPAGFSDYRHLGDTDVFRPLAFDAKESRERNATWVRVVGRRAPGVPPSRPAAFIAEFGKRLAQDHPAENASATWRTVAIDDSFIDPDSKQIFAMLVGLSGMVLLIACSNLANLSLARTMARAKEFAVRSALGASRAQVLRPLLIESLVLALAGGLCALLVANWSFNWFSVATVGESGVGVDLTFDWRVLAWAIGASFFTAIAFGVAPALFIHRLDLNGTIKSGSHVTGDRGHRRFRQVLIVGQFALAMVLLAGAAHFVRGLRELNDRHKGWDSDHLVTGTAVLRPSAYAGDKEISDFQRLALDHLEALPGVESASISWAMPFFGLAEQRKYVAAGRDLPQPGHEPAAMINGVTPHYFETVGTRLVSGRTFTASDTRTSPRVFIVNQAMARGLFGEERAIGRRIGQAGQPIEWGEIVGVVADVQPVYPDPGPVTWQLYQPMAQEPRRFSELAVRVAGPSPVALVERIRATMMTLDADLPIRKLQPANATILRANYQTGVLATILSALALLGLGLAALGVYGVIARTVAQRTGEFGIRLALGAEASDITRLVLSSGAKLAGIGAAIGLLGAFAVTRVLGASFPGIQTSSVPVAIGAAALLVAIAQIASYVPARHASKISPTEALRAE